MSKNEGFHQLDFLRDHPPKTFWLRLGNCSTIEIERTLRASCDEVAEFLTDDEGAFLIVQELWSQGS